MNGQRKEHSGKWMRLLRYALRSAISRYNEKLNFFLSLVLALALAFHNFCPTEMLSCAWFSLLLRIILLFNERGEMNRGAKRVAPNHRRIAFACNNHKNTSKKGTANGWETTPCGTKNSHSFITVDIEAARKREKWIHFFVNYCNCCYSEAKSEHALFGKCWINAKNSTNNLFSSFGA